MNENTLKPAHDAPCPYCNGRGTVPVAAEVATVECFYFGCWSSAGHYWFDRHGQWLRRQDEGRMPERLRHGRADGNYCPGMSNSDDVNERRRDRRTRPEVDGEAALHHVDGWTALAYWDRSVDHRGASCSVFAARGLYDYPTMRQIALAQFPKIWQRRTEPVLVLDHTRTA